MALKSAWIKYYKHILVGLFLVIVTDIAKNGMKQRAKSILSFCFQITGVGARWELNLNVLNQCTMQKTRWLC